MVSGKLATRRAQIVAECMNYPAVVNRGRAIPWQPKAVYRNSLARLPVAHRHLSSLFLPCLTHFSSVRLRLPHAIGVAWQCMTISLVSTSPSLPFLPERARSASDRPDSPLLRTQLRQAAGWDHGFRFQTLGSAENRWLCFQEREKDASPPCTYTLGWKFVILCFV